METVLSFHYLYNQFILHPSQYRLSVLCILLLICLSYKSLQNLKNWSKIENSYCFLFEVF